MPADLQINGRRLLSFPPCGNVLNKALDSGLRRNDDSGFVPIFCYAGA